MTAAVAGFASDSETKMQHRTVLRSEKATPPRFSPSSISQSFTTSFLSVVDLDLSSFVAVITPNDPNIESIMKFLNFCLLFHFCPNEQKVHKVA